MASPIASILFLSLQAAVLPSGLPEPLVATPDDAAPMRIHVGNTGIHCVRLPCPSRGVFVPGERSHTAHDRMLYADMDGETPPPPMVGDEALLAAITTAWEERACLAIDGRLITGEDDRPVLRVARVIGPCGDRPK